MATHYVLGNGNTELEAFPTYHEAKRWVDRYTRNDFGGWTSIAIVVYGRDGLKDIEFETEAPDPDFDDYE